MTTTTPELARRASAHDDAGHARRLHARPALPAARRRAVVGRARGARAAGRRGARAGRLRRAGRDRHRRHAASVRARTRPVLGVPLHACAASTRCQDTRTPFLVNVVENARQHRCSRWRCSRRSVCRASRSSYSGAYAIAAVLALGLLRRRIGAVLPPPVRDHRCRARSSARRPRCGRRRSSPPRSARLVRVGGRDRRRRGRHRGRRGLRRGARRCCGRTSSRGLAARASAVAAPVAAAETCNHGLDPEHRITAPQSALEEEPMAVRIVTDSASDLPQDVCDELGIEVVPLTIRFGDNEYVDRKELSTDAVLAQARVVVRAAGDGGAVGRGVRGDLPRRSPTAAPTASCASTSRRSCRRRCSRRRSPPRRSTGCARSRSSTRRARRWASATSSSHAARRAKEGADLATIVRDVEARRERQHILAALDTLEYLRKGGRIGGARAMLGSMLSIKPIISVVDGAVDEAGKVRTRGKALQFILDRVPAQGIEQIAVLHAGAPDIDDFLGKLPAKHRRRRDRRRQHRTGDRRAHGPARPRRRVDRDAS